MADEEVKEQEEQEAIVEEKPKGGKTMILLGAGLAMIVVAVVLVVFVLFPKYQELTGQTSSEPEEIVEEEKPVSLGNIFKIENITINPKGSMGRRFAVFEVALEYGDDPEFGDTLFKLQPMIIDRFISYLRTKTVMELSRSTEIDTIRFHMKNIVNDMVKREAISNLYFTRFVLE